MFWALLVGIVIGVLIWQEQISVLYVLTTIALAVLLFIVGWSDLEHAEIDSSLREGGNK